MSKIMNFTIFGLFILILAISIPILITSFINLNHTNRQVISYVNEAKEHIINNSASMQKEIPSSSKLFVEQILTSAKSCLESNTISFLFQIFSITLISVGVYLLSEAKKKISKLKKQYIDLEMKMNSLTLKYDEICLINNNIRQKQESLVPFLNCILIGNKIEHFLSFAHQSIVQKNIVEARDWLQSSENEIKKINEKKLGLAPEQIELMKDRIDKIENTLRKDKKKNFYEDHLKPIQKYFIHEQFIPNYKEIENKLMCDISTQSLEKID